MENKEKIIIYKTDENEVSIDVKLENDTVWLSQVQMAELFGKDRNTISLHLNNVYDEGELALKATTQDSWLVRLEGDREVKRSITLYNLDAILSVGYRVNSKQGTQFRIWATNILHNHIIKGYTLNEKRLEDLQTSVQLIKKAASFGQINLDEAQGLLNVITEYANTWILLNKYDEHELSIQSNTKTLKELTYELARKAIDKLSEKLVDKKEAGDLFGNERGEYFKGILNSINQKFAGEDLYASFEEKAANLLYLIIKDHPFSDGNKRIGSMLFIYFIKTNGFLLKKNGEKKINDNALTALALLVAISEPKEKDQMVKLITNLLVE